MNRFRVSSIAMIVALVGAGVFAGALAPAPAVAQADNIRHFHGVNVGIYEDPGVVVNHGKAKIWTEAWPVTGVHLRILRKAITARLANRRSLTGPHSVEVPAGRYPVSVKIRYQPWAPVVRHHNVKVTVPADMLTASCKVLALRAVPGHEPLKEVTAMTCTSPVRPGQSVTGSGINLTGSDTGGDYTVGQLITVEQVQFPAYVRSESRPYTVRRYGAVRTFSTPTIVETVKDGGFERIYAASSRSSRATPYFRVPAHWAVDYDLNGCYSARLHLRGSTAANDLSLTPRYEGYGTWQFRGRGTFRLEVDDTCRWSFVVRWH